MMDSESSNPHKRSRSRRSRGGASGRSSRRDKRSSSRSTSSFATVSTPSIASISAPTSGRKDAPSCAAFLAGLIGVAILILLGGGHNPLALGLALILPGVALLLRPPALSLGKWLDVGIVGLLASFLFAFLPLFYWPAPPWRKTAVEAFEIELPSVLSVQPLISFEALLMAVAGFAWLYAASNWKINHAGRARFYFWLSCVISSFAAVAIWGNLSGWRYPGAEGSQVFSFFPNRNQTSNFLAIGGVVAFGYAMEGLRGRKLLHLSGFLATALCLGALVMGFSRAGVFLYFAGIFIWFFFRLRQTCNSLFFKIGLPVVLLIFSFFISSHEGTVERVTDFISAPAEWDNEYRALLYQDTIQMIGDTPLTGVGVGNFAAVFPQYRELSRSYQRAVHPESDVFWLAAEGGLLAIIFLGVFLFAYFKKCRNSGGGRSGAYRSIALTAVVLFVLHALVDVPGHRPGTVYFAILFAALALPRREAERPSFKPVVWRVIGGGLLLVGALWMAGSLFNLPLHSKSIIAIEQGRVAESLQVGDYERAEESATKLIHLQPMAWRSYFQRAQITLALTGNRTEVARDFRRARFVEPTLGVVSYEEGQVWLRDDAGRTISAWRETLFRDILDKDSIYMKMLQDARKRPALMERMIELSMLNSNYRSRLLLFLKGDAFMAELRRDLRLDPALGQFSREERTALVRRWITLEDSVTIEAYLNAYGETLDRPWFMLSLLRKEQGRFKEALDVLRAALSVPEIPKTEMDDKTFVRLKRGFFLGVKDVIKGSALLRAYLDEENYTQALEVAGALLEISDPPAYVYYWQAELLYRMGDYLESWHAFEAYLERVH